MAKKGVVQQLQSEIFTDEEFESFMEREGLLLLDVYTAWCGPCVGMIGSLKKIKLELGGDNLHLAIVRHLLNLLRLGSSVLIIFPFQCKSDTVSYMERFRMKSEPTWLFASHGKIVNCLFGTNVPELMQMITDELVLEEKYNAGEGQRKFYEWTQLTPIEQERENKRKALEEETNRIEHEADRKRRAEYLTFVTNEIMERLPDAGVTFIMPNYAEERDIQKKLAEPGDKCGLIMKDRRLITIQESDLEVILFELTNPLHKEVYKKLFEVEILAVYWKTHDTELRDVLDLLANYVDILCNPQPLINENGEPDPELKMPPVFKPWKIDFPQDVYKEILVDMGINEEKEEHEKTSESAHEGSAESEGSPRPPSTEGGASGSNAQHEQTPVDPATLVTATEGTSKPESAKPNETEVATPTTEGVATTTPRTDVSAETTPRTDDSAETTPRSDESDDITPRTDESGQTTERTEPSVESAPEGTEGSPEKPPEKSPVQSPPHSKPPSKPSTPPPAAAADREEALGMEPETESAHEEPEIPAAEIAEEPIISTLNIPAIYAAANKRGNAALIYLYFRHLTDHFLPPDPVPEPPHLAVIFDAIKRKDVCQLMATMNEGDVLAYGYFDGIDPNTAHLLAKTTDLYLERLFNMEDKMVLKVAKKTSNVLLSFVGLGPTFVSFSTDEGKEECKKFFPRDYNKDDEEIKKEEEDRKAEEEEAILKLAFGVFGEPAAAEQDAVTDGAPTVAGDTAEGHEAEPPTAAVPAEGEPNVEAAPVAELSPATEASPAAETAPAVDAQPATEAPHPETEAPPAAEAPPAVEAPPVTEAPPAAKAPPAAEAPPVEEPAPSTAPAPEAESPPAAS